MDPAPMAEAGDVRYRAIATRSKSRQVRLGWRAVRWHQHRLREFPCRPRSVCRRNSVSYFSSFSLLATPAGLRRWNRVQRPLPLLKHAASAESSSRGHAVRICELLAPRGLISERRRRRCRDVCIVTRLKNGRATVSGRRVHRHKTFSYPRDALKATSRGLRLHSATSRQRKNIRN